MGPQLYRVVLIDEDDDLRSVVRQMPLFSRRFEVVAEGRTGAEAINHAARYRPTIMVLDGTMPDMDGLEALPSILEASPETKVVMLTGYGGRVHEMAARALGAADFVVKTAPLRELPDRLLHVLEDSEATPAEPAGRKRGGAPASGIPEVDLRDAGLAGDLERFTALFNQAVLGLATLARSGRVVRANPALLRITHLSEEDLVSRP